MKKSWILFLLMLIVSLYAKAQQMNSKVALKRSNLRTPSAYSNANLTYSITNVLNNTYGYDIYAEEKKIIQQNSIPELNGNEGFNTRESAQKVAQLVIKKIKNGEMPPTVTKNEMQELKALSK